MSDVSTVEVSNDGEDEVDTPAKHFKPDYSETIAVLVGKDEKMKRFIIHKTTVCAMSPYCKAACSSNWTEGKEGVIKLPEVDPKAFVVFVHWAYTAKVDMSLLQPKGAILYSNFGRVWSVAHYLQSLDLCNAIVDQVIDKHTHYPEKVPSDFGDDLHAPNSGFRRLMIDIVAVSARDYSNGFATLPSDVMFRLLDKFGRGETRANSSPLNQGRCYYHEHAPGDPTCSA